jgi:putative transposase
MGLTRAADTLRRRLPSLDLYQGTASAVPPIHRKESGFNPLIMARPARHANPSHILSPSRTFFVTTKASMGRALLQSERNPTLLIDVLRSYVTTHKFELHDFVVMPDHVHLLITVRGNMTIEKAMQFIEGGFSFRLRKEFGYLGEVWQREFSEVRVDDRHSFLRYRDYIAHNPVESGRADSRERFPYCFTYLAKRKAQGLRPANGRH